MKALFAALFALLLLSCKSKMPVANESKVSGDTLQTYIVTTENIMEASLYLPDEYMNFNEVTIDKDSILSSHLQIEMIEKESFEKMQGTAVSFWEEDTKGAVKVDTLLTFKARDTILTFIDDTTDNETHRTFSYEGRLPVINQFVVLGIYYEDYGYMLIDMNTGNNTSTYQAFPLISPDKKFIISLYADIYSPQAGELSIEKIGVDGAIIPLLNASFTNWMPHESFFGTDGYLYVSVNHPSQYWQADGEVNDVHQFLKIKIL